MRSRCAHQGSKDASGEKLSGRAQECSRHIRIRSSARMPGPGNGDYRGELRRAIAVIASYAAKLGLPPTAVLLRLDGLYGDAAPLMDVLTAGLGVIARSRASHEARIWKASSRRLLALQIG